MEPARHWRTQKIRYQLIAGVCERCDWLGFPWRERCTKCRQPIGASRCLRGSGTVYSYSTVFQAPLDFLHFTPYVVALIQLDEGLLITAQLTDVHPGSVRIGMEVELVVRRLRDESPSGIVLYGYKFRPRLEIGSPDMGSEDEPGERLARAKPEGGATP